MTWSSATGDSVLNEISDGLALFSQRWVVVEFIPGDDPEVGSLWSDWFDGYTLDNFKRALRRNFPKIEVLPSHPSSRVLLFANGERDSQCARPGWERASFFSSRLAATAIRDFAAAGNSLLSPNF